MGLGVLLKKVVGFLLDKSLSGLGSVVILLRSKFLWKAGITVAVFSNFFGNVYAALKLRDTSFLSAAGSGLVDTLGGSVVQAERGLVMVQNGWEWSWRVWEIGGLQGVWLLLSGVATLYIFVRGLYLWREKGSSIDPDLMDYALWSVILVLLIDKAGASTELMNLLSGADQFVVDGGVESVANQSVNVSDGGGGVTGMIAAFLG